MLKDGRIAFEGNASGAARGGRASDPYIQAFLS